MGSQTEFFNAVADRWDDICHHDETRIRQILNGLMIRKGDVCLDVGTGTGVMIPYLMERIGGEGKIIAVDLAEQMLAVARQKYTYPNVSFLCGDALAMELPDAFFDVAVCYSVFPHFQDKLSALHVLGRRLKAGGRLLIGHSQSREAINNMHRNADQAVAEDVLPDALTLRSWVEQAGLQVLHAVDDVHMFVLVAEKESIHSKYAQ